MKIAIVTQEDAFYIPRLIETVIASRSDVVALTVLAGETQKSGRNIRKYVDFMGLRDFVAQATRYAIYGVLDRLFPRGVRGRFFSVRAVGRKRRLTILEPQNVNDREHLDALRRLGVDLIISVASPHIFRKELLSLPKHGCINIHNGLLPAYQGVLPSFWVLANGEEWTGTTVHYMNERIDAGEILLQERTKIEPDDTLHSLVYRTKITIGPRLLLRAIEMIESGSVRTITVDWSKATYFRFPDRDAVRRFRALGRRFR